MSLTTSSYDSDVSPLRATSAIVLLLALFSVFAFASPRDRSKPVAGLPCAVLSENDISAVVGTPVQLMPSMTGTVCRYVSMSNGPSRSVIVVARATRPRTFAFHVIPQSTSDTTAIAQEAQLTRLVRRQVASAR